MRLTNALWEIHMGRMKQFNWFAHVKRKLVLSSAEAALEKQGISVVNAIDVVKPPPRPLLEDNFWQYMVPPQPVKFNHTHPDWKGVACWKYENDDLLAIGMDQAQNLVKTLYVQNGLPDRIVALLEDQSEDINASLERIIYTATLYEAHQEKLPKKKDPAKPMWVFPRYYGIPDARKSRNLIVSMIQLCEMLCGPSVNQQRLLVQNGIVQLTMEKEGNFLLFNINNDLMMTSKKSLTPIENPENTFELTLPNLYPMSSLINLKRQNIYLFEDLYPIAQNSSYSNVHTIFIYHDKSKIINFTELPVKENQIESRSLMKCFITAASNARQKYGDNVKDLPEPVTIQCIQSDSQSFLFSVFQLNTLDIDGTEGKSNFWWCAPKISLYEKSMYENGIPIVENYNPEIFKTFLAFYKNM